MSVSRLEAGRGMPALAQSSRFKVRSGAMRQLTAGTIEYDNGKSLDFPGCSVFWKQTGKRLPLANTQKSEYAAVPYFI